MLKNNNETRKAFARAVKAKRYSKGIIHFHITRVAKLHPRRFTILEEGKQCPSLNEAKNIATALGMPLWELIKEAGL